MNLDFNLSVYQHKGKRGDPKVRLKASQLQNNRRQSITLD